MNLKIKIIDTDWTEREFAEMPRPVLRGISQRYAIEQE